VSGLIRSLPLKSSVVLGLLLAPASLAAAEQLLAQNFLGTVQPGRERALPEAAPPAELDFTIQAPRRSPVPRAAEELSFELKDITLSGVSAYRAEDFRPLIEPVVGRTIHLSDLIGVAEKIEEKYRTDGYILSRAYVPTQNVTNGIFQIAVVEGYVSATSVVGGDASTRERVEALLSPVPSSRPLKLETIEHALVTANTIPGANVSGLLRPSATEPGASDLVVTVSSEPYTLLLSTDNRSSQSNGAWTESVDLAVRSPLDDGGQILLNVSSSNDFNQRNSVQGKYVLPVGAGGATLSMSGLVSHGEPAGAVADLKLVSDSIAVGPHVSYPLIVGRQERLSIEGGVTWQSADVHVLAAPYSHDEWRVADIGLAYQNAALFGGANTASVDLARGLDIFGASKDGSPTLSRVGGRSDFTKLSAQLRRVQTLDGPLSVSITGSGQYAFNTLLIGEEMSFGGAQIGRGYDPAAITGDNGMGGALELRYDLDASDLHLDQAQLYTFYDTAKVWVHTGRISENKLQSTGGGLRTVAFKNISLAVELARSLLPVATSGNGKRDSRVFFNGSIKF